MSRFFLCLALLVPALATGNAVETPAKPPVITEGQPAGFEVKGLLIPFEEMILGSRAKGVIRKIKNEGEKIKAGDVVMELEDDMEKLQVEQQEKVLEKRQFEGKINERLLEQKAVSENDGMDARINLDIAKIMLGQAKTLLDRRTLRSPVEGVITKRLRERGEAVDEFTPVMTAVNLSKVYLEAYLPSSRIREVKEGQAVEVRVPAFPDMVFNGKITFVAPVINAASDEFRIKVLLPNEPEVLRSGMSAFGRVMPVKSEAKR